MPLKGLTLKLILIATFTFFAATPAFSQDATTPDLQSPVDVGFCEGPNFIYRSASLTLEEMAILEPEMMPMPEGTFLMTYAPEALGKPSSFGWASQTAGMPAYCEDADYRLHAPKHGQWKFELENVNLTGCPEALDPTRGLQSVTTINWDRYNGPVGALDRFSYPFAMVRNTALHYTYTADQMPQIPGTVLIVYDFKAISPDRIDVIGGLSIKIEAGGNTILNCAGTLEMRGHPIP